MYYFDNESFRHLVATAPPNNMVFNTDLQYEHNVSWSKSVNECKRLLQYLCGLTPFTINLNLDNLAQPLLNENQLPGNNAKKPQINPKKPFEKIASTSHETITILLLGESGVGKSTFINAFVNYITYENMYQAKERPICLIPVNFTIADRETYRLRTVTLGTQDNNENTQDATESVTQYPKCYKFEIGNVTLNIIDTPGIADTKGIDKDNTSMRNILNFISNYREINAICVLLKPNNAKLFSHLNKSAADNILFLFTNVRSTQYAPGDTGPALITLLDQIKERPPFVDIKYGKPTIYCFDNEAFWFAVASAPPNNIVFDDMLTRDYEVSWEGSVKECDRLLERIISLSPHIVMETLSQNNAKQHIILLTQPLADIAKNISDNVKECERHKRKIHEFTGNIKDLQKELDKKCCTQENINGNIKTHYKTNCHSPCYLKHSDGNIVGNKGLLNCKAFNKYERTGPDHWDYPDDLVPDTNIELNKDGKLLLHTVSTTKSDKCFGCGHSYQTHLHINYETKIVKKQVRDESKYERITTAKEMSLAQEKQIKKLESKIQELSEENLIITKATAKFPCFL
ncbi:unnamed protein product [Oppiella nova]|uniref:G domain-containing protein n=1 Tax=Oppiella nova TaxID=334625 RepID=A0A7R9QFI6_9ACAR|nr:unnamed protein product [Oppiella nova]CAG2164726.1 unnamed protein product [Oppiella nova]